MLIHKTFSCYKNSHDIGISSIYHFIVPQLFFIIQHRKLFYTILEQLRKKIISHTQQCYFKDWWAQHSDPHTFLSRDTSKGAQHNSITPILGRCWETPWNYLLPVQFIVFTGFLSGIWAIGSNFSLCTYI
jgi:hypothetical protein